MTALDPRALRNAFGCFMTGVTVVTCRAADGTPVGFTANSFSSVSLDPPMLLVCPGKVLSSYESFVTCTHFAVNVLSEGQEDVAGVFARHKGDRFAQVAHLEDAYGNALIQGALAQFSCQTHQVIDAGDHAILLGAVKRYEQVEGRGLGYAGGQFFSLGLERAALEHASRGVVCGAIVSHEGQVLLEKSAAGYRPPQIVAAQRDQLRQALAQSLQKQGLTIRLGPVYSVFDEDKIHRSYILATPQSPGDGPFESHCISDIPRLKFASQPIAEMMNRFATETQTHTFGLYVGDARQGDIHLPERS